MLLEKFVVLWYDIYNGEIFAVKNGGMEKTNEDFGLRKAGAGLKQR